MKTFQTFLTGFINWNHPLSEYFNDFQKKKKLYTHELLSKLEEAIILKDAVLIEYLVIIIFEDGPDKLFSKVLCKLLSEEWHYTHEDIVSLLEEIKDPETIECIYQATFREAGFDDDDVRPLTVKCLRALYAINTPEALEKIKLFSTSKNTHVKDTVSLLLNS